MLVSDPPRRPAENAGGASPAGRAVPSAEIIAVGSELLTPFRLDTNSLRIADELNRLGIGVVRKTVIGDHCAALAAALADAAARSTLVIVTGGLGPTEDDRTREAAAAGLGIPLARQGEIEAQLRERFAARGQPMPARNLQQADLLAGAEILANPNGTAPGQWLATPTGIVILLPGPPRELRPMLEKEVMPRLRAWLEKSLGVTAAPLVARTLRIADRPESAVDDLAAPIYTQFPRIETTILASAPGEIEIQLRAPAAEALSVDSLVDRLAGALGAALFSRRGEGLAETVGAALRQRGETLAVAESCTGGLLGARLTEVAGSSEYFLGGLIVYSDESKQRLAGVRAPTLERSGAVSAECARELAAGVRERLGADWGVAITGIAGPGGGSAAKPVGTAYIAVAGAENPVAGDGEVAQRLFAGERDRIRRHASTVALDMLRRRLTGAG